MEYNTMIKGTEAKGQFSNTKLQGTALLHGLIKELMALQCSDYVSRSNK